MAAASTDHSPVATTSYPQFHVSAAPCTALPPSSSIRLTWEGLFWLLAALVLLTQGWVRGVNLVALLACCLIALWILNVLWVALRFRIKVLRLQRRLEGAVFADQPFTATLEIENPTGRNQPGLRIIDQAVQYRHSWFIPVLKRRSSARQPYAVTLRRRGLYRWPELILTTAYPFGLVRKTLRYTSEDQTLVLPSIGRLHRGRLRRLLLHRQQEITSTKRPIRRLPGSQTEFYGVRDFRSGDSPRWIHWRTTARIGDLMVREFEEPPHDNLVLIVDPWLPRPLAALEADLDEVRRQNQKFIQMLLASGPSPTPEKRRAKEMALARKELPLRKPLDTLERMLSLAATICWEWCRHSGSRFVLAVGGEQPCIHRVDTSLTRVWPLLESLALVEGSSNADVPRLVKLLSDEPLPAAPVLLLSTHASGLDVQVGGAIRRRVLALDTSQPAVESFFEPFGGEK